MHESILDYYKNIADSLPIIVWIIRPNGSPEYFNQKWYDYIGDDYVPGTDAPKIVHPNDVQKLQSRWNESLKTLKTFEFEYRMLNGKTQKYSWFMGKGLPIRDDKGKVIGWFGTSISINNEKKNRIITRGALDSLNAEIAVINKEGIILQNNKAWEASPLQKIGIGSNYLQYLKKMYANEDIKKMYDGIKHVLNGTLASFTHEYPCYLPAEDCWFVMSANPLELEDGGAVISHLDITERIKAQILLKNSEEYNRTLIESSPDKLTVIDLKGNMQSMNMTGIESLGLDSFETLHNTPWDSIWAPRHSTKVKKALMQAVSGKAGHFQALSLLPKGTTRWWDVVLSPIRDAQGKVIHVFSAARDITRLIELENQKDEFIGIVSHELKTPVTSIRIFNTALRKIAQKVKNELASNITAKMDVQIVKLTRLITDLLDVNKIRAGKLTFNMSTFVLEDVVQESIDAVQAASENHRIINNITTKSTVYADADRTGQVFTNLLNNAIKYSPNADKIVVTSNETKTHIKICVQDFGLGINKSQQKKIFRQYYQVSNNKKENFPGLGLGLYLSAYIVKRVNGKIWVESELGKGSTFCVEFAKKK